MDQTVEKPSVRKNLVFWIDGAHWREVLYVIVHEGLTVFK